MDIKKIEIQDKNNNVYYPKTSADNVIYNNKNLSELLSLIMDSLNNSSTNSNSKIIKKIFKNVSANSGNSFDLAMPIDNAYIINVYKGIVGNTNLSDTLKTFNSDAEQDFIKNDNEIKIDNNGSNIIDEYTYTSTENTGKFESQEIDVQNFKIINEISSI